MFKYLDLVKVVKPEPPPGAVVILNTDGANDALAFYTGAVGRVIARVPGGYKVWFPVPCFPDKGQAVDLAEKTLKLFHEATEKDYRAAHYPGMSASLPMMATSTMVPSPEMARFVQPDPEAPKDRDIPQTPHNAEALKKLVPVDGVFLKDSNDAEAG